MDVGIIGCGTAGGASAILLSRAGHRVTLYERFLTPQPIGAGIVLQPTGLAALQRLGLLERVLSRGARIERLHVENTRGRTIVDLRYPEVRPDLFGLGIHRGALFEALFEMLQRERVKLRLGMPIARITSEGRQQLCTSESGLQCGPHDLVIVADGARSQHRDPTRIAARSFDYRYGALWFCARDPGHEFHTELHQVVEGTSTMLGFLPTGFGPGSETVPVVSLYWSIRDDHVAEVRGPGFAAWKARVLSLNRKAAPVLAQIDRGERLLFSSYKHVAMPRWHHRGIVHLGDAGHAMSPQLGQGANLALFDAVVLADCLSVEASELPRALERYSKLRQAHLRFYQFATRWLTPFFQSDHEWLGTLRDLGMSLMTRIKPLRLEMARSMIGIKRGIVRPSLPLPTLQLPAAHDQ